MIHVWVIYQFFFEPKLLTISLISMHCNGDIVRNQPRFYALIIMEQIVPNSVYVCGLCIFVDNLCLETDFNILALA